MRTFGACRCGRRTYFFPNGNDIFPNQSSPETFVTRVWVAATFMIERMEWRLPELDENFNFSRQQNYMLWPIWLGYNSRKFCIEKECTFESRRYQTVHRAKDGQRPPLCSPPPIFLMQAPSPPPLPWDGCRIIGCVPFTPVAQITTRTSHLQQMLFFHRGQGFPPL